MPNKKMEEQYSLENFLILYQGQGKDWINNPVTQTFLQLLQNQIIHLSDLIVNAHLTNDKVTINKKQGHFVEQSLNRAIQNQGKIASYTTVINSIARQVDEFNKMQNKEYKPDSQLKNYAPSEDDQEFTDTL